MNRDKQIEEMACEKCLHFEACQIAFRNSKSLGIYDCTEEEYFNSTLDCDYYTDKNIYRKASEVVDEFVKTMIDRFGVNPFDRMNIDVRDLAELKKKYTGERKMRTRYKKVCPFCKSICENFIGSNLFCNCNAKYYFFEKVWLNRNTGEEVRESEDTE